MALRNTPGPLLKDGQAFTDIENELKNFVQGTEILNIGLDNFQLDNTPFVISQSEPPSFLTKGQLWFNRTEGRLYSYFTQGVSGASYQNAAGTSEVRGSSILETNHWIAVSDRKEVYALYQALEPAPNFTVQPYGPVRLGAGRISNAAGNEWIDAEQNNQSVIWEAEGDVQEIANFDLTGIWSSNNNAFAGMRLESWGNLIYSPVMFVHTTSYTLADRNMFGGVFHDLGYRRVASQDSTYGPAHGVVRGVGETTVSPDVRNLKQPPSDYPNPYDLVAGTGYGYAGYITESGPAKTHSAGPGANAPYTHHAFWFAASPVALFTPSD